MEQNSKNEFDGVWAVVLTAANKYIGCIDAHSIEYAREMVLGGSRLKLSPAYILKVLDIPVRLPGKDIQLQMNVFGTSLGLCTSDSTVYCQPTDVWLLDDMSPMDKEAYLGLVRQAREQMLNTRSEKLGLVRASSIPQTRS